ILILAMTSDTHSVSQIYDAADSILAQKLAQVEGVGQVTVGGGAKPAVRVELNPRMLESYHIGLEQVRTTLANANAHAPKRALSNGDSTWQLDATDQLFKAADYAKLIIGYNAGNAVRLGDVASLQDSVQDRRNTGISNGKSAVLVILYR